MSVLFTLLLAVAIILYMEREQRREKSEHYYDWREFRSGYNPESREELEKLKEAFRKNRL